MSDKINASTIARIAGNLLSGYATVYEPRRQEVVLSVQRAVALARSIAAEVGRTEIAPAEKEKK
jgi:hypothetical protein